MRVCVLGSGSRGNSALIASEETRILIDAGLSARTISHRLHQIGVDPATLSGIVLTHEHADHESGTRILAQRYSLPIYMNRGTMEGLEAGRLKSWKAPTFPTSEPPSLQAFQPPRFLIFESNRPFKIGDLSLEGFSISHDANDPVAFAISSNSFKVGLAWDLGLVTHLVVEKLKDCHFLILEFNHDLGMLLDGPYPWEVKQRVKGPLGHLSNEQSAELLCEVAHRDLRWVVLAHISEVNNKIEFVWKKAQEALKSRRMSGRTRLSVASQKRVGELISLEGGI